MITPVEDAAGGEADKYSDNGSPQGMIKFFLREFTDKSSSSIPKLIDP
jgi:hypothetical protein